MSDNFIVVSPDAHLYDPVSGLYRGGDPAALTDAWDKAHDEWAAAMKAARRPILLIGLPGSGKSTFVSTGRHIGDDRLPRYAALFDATLTTRQERQILLEMADRLPVTAVVFTTPLTVCLQRNRARPADRRVPFPVISRMARNLESDPVTLQEGFSQILRADDISSNQVG